MEIESKFLVKGREDFERMVRMVEIMGYRVCWTERCGFTDVYIKTGRKDEALRYRIFEDGRVIRTFKRKLGFEGGVVKRIEEEKPSTYEEFLKEKNEKGVLIETLSKREIRDYGDFKISFDSVIFGDSTNMLFVEIEGDEGKVREITRKLVDNGFTVERRSKLEIGLNILGEKV